VGAAAILSGILTFFAFGAGSLIAAPLAITFAVTAFWWNLTRPGGAGLRIAPAGGGPCRGCNPGCVECRERIDVR
jgi:hypothetical protein